MPSSPAKRWCFTINNYSDQDIDKLKAFITEDTCKYAIVGKEIGDKRGTKHLQGFVHLVEKLRLSGLKEKLCAKAHYEGAKGTDEHNKVYCSKGDDVLIEVGTPQQGSEKGGGGQYLQRAEIIARKRAAGEPVDLTDSTNAKTHLIYGRRIGELVANLEETEHRKRVMKRYEGVVWKPWQRQILDLVSAEPHSRKVHWYVDFKGNTGKSFLTTYMAAKELAASLENGKSADIKYAYRGERAVVFDYARSQQDHINYEIIESLKNGRYLSTKYESKRRLYDIPHVIIFANFEPTRSKLSEDRWDIKFIQDDQVFDYDVGDADRPTADTDDDANVLSLSASLPGSTIDQQVPDC